MTGKKVWTISDGFMSSTEKGGYVSHEAICVLNTTSSSRLNCKREIEIYLDRLKEQEIICEFDEELFAAVVDKITVYNDKLMFMFRDGTEMKYELK